MIVLDNYFMPIAMTYNVMWKKFLRIYTNYDISTKYVEIE